MNRPAGFVAHYGRAILGAMLVIWSWSAALVSQIDFNLVGSTIATLSAAGVGAWLLLQNAKLRVQERTAKADREERQAAFVMEQEHRKQSIALELREKRLRDRTANRMQLERDKAMKGTLTAQIEELTRQLELTKAAVKATEEAAAAERAEILERSKAAEERATAAEERAAQTERRLADLLAMSHRSISARLDRGDEKLKEIKDSIDGQRRILVVEDDRDACRALALLLRSEGFEAECAHSLAEARKKFTGRCYWVWVDLHLPDGSGLDFAREVKATGKNIKVGLMTGRDTDEVEADADLAQVDLMRTKPLGRIAELVEDMRGMDEESPRTANRKPMKRRK